MDPFFLSLTEKEHIVYGMQTINTLSLPVRALNVVTGEAIDLIAKTNPLANKILQHLGKIVQENMPELKGWKEGRQRVIREFQEKYQIPAEDTSYCLDSFEELVLAAGTDGLSSLIKSSVKNVKKLETLVASKLSGHPAVEEFLFNPTTFKRPEIVTFGTRKIPGTEGFVDFSYMKGTNKSILIYLHYIQKGRLTQKRIVDGVVEQPFISFEHVRGPKSYGVSEEGIRQLVQFGQQKSARRIFLQYEYNPKFHSYISRKYRFIKEDRNIAKKFTISLEKDINPIFEITSNSPIKGLLGVLKAQQKVTFIKMLYRKKNPDQEYNDSEYTLKDNQSLLPLRQEISQGSQRTLSQESLSLSSQSPSTILEQIAEKICSINKDLIGFDKNSNSNKPDLNACVPLDNLRNTSATVTIPVGQTSQVGAQISLTSLQNSSISASTDFSSFQASVLINPKNLKSSSFSVTRSVGKNTNLGVIINPSNLKNIAVTSAFRIGSMNFNGTFNLRHLQRSEIAVSVPIPICGVPIGIGINTSLNHLDKARLTIGYPGTPFQVSLSLRKLIQIEKKIFRQVPPLREASKAVRKFKKSIKKIFGHKKRKRIQTPEEAMAAYNGSIFERSLEHCYHIAFENSLCPEISKNSYERLLYQDWVHNCPKDKCKAFIHFPSLLLDVVQKSDFNALLSLSPRAHAFLKQKLEEETQRTIFEQQNSFLAQSTNFLNHENEIISHRTTVLKKIGENQVSVSKNLTRLSDHLTLIKSETNFLAHQLKSLAHKTSQNTAHLHQADVALASAVAERRFANNSLNASIRKLQQAISKLKK